MTPEYFKNFRKKYFPGKMSKEAMAVEFGVKYHTLRRYEGENANSIPMVLQRSILFFEEKEALKLQLKGKK